MGRIRTYIALTKTLAINLGLFVAGLTLGTQLIQEMGGEFVPGAVAANTAFFDVHRDEINVVFVGTSRFGRNIDPEVFDARMAEHGYATRSFNYWLGNMQAPEARRIVRELLAQDPDPHLLIVESLPTLTARRRETLTDRSLWWRHIEEMPYLIDDLRDSGGIDELDDHLVMTLIAWFRVGKGVDIAHRVLKKEPPLPRPARQGHRPMLEKRIEGPFDVAAELLEIGPLASKAPYHRKFHRQIAEIVDGQARVLMLFPAGSRMTYLAFPDSDGLIFMNRPDRYPELYDHENWADFSHLLAGSVPEHSRLLADEVAATLGEDRLMR